MRGAKDERKGERKRRKEEDTREEAIRGRHNENIGEGI
jgi:hypothetical protein